MDQRIDGSWTSGPAFPRSCWGRAGGGCCLALFDSKSNTRPVAKKEKGRGGFRFPKPHGRPSQQSLIIRVYVTCLVQTVTQAFPTLLQSLNKSKFYVTEES